MDLLFGTLAAVGAVCVLFCAFGFLLLPARCGAAVLPVRGDGNGAERELHALYFLHTAGLLRQRVVLLDCGLDETGRRTVAALLRAYPAVSLWTPAEFLEQMETEQGEQRGDPARRGSCRRISE